MKRHLSAFKPGPHSETAARPLPLRAARRGFPMPRTHALSDALPSLVGAVGRTKCSDVKCHRVAVYFLPFLPGLDDLAAAAFPFFFASIAVSALTFPRATCFDFFPALTGSAAATGAFAAFAGISSSVG